MSRHPGKIVTTEATEDVWSFENEWSANICDCCSNTKRCCFAHFCYACFVCSLFNRTNECFCTPCFIPGSLMSLRAKIRTGFRIKGSLFSDFLLTFCCPMCSAIQIANELDIQGL